MMRKDSETGSSGRRGPLFRHLGRDLERVKDSAPMIFVTWMFLALLGWGPSAIFSTHLTPAPGPDPSGALFVEAIFAAGPALRSGAIALLAALTLLWLASPLLSVSFLSSLERPRRVSEALSIGARRYFSAVTATLCLCPVLVIALALAGAGAVGADAALSDATEPAHDLAMVLATTPGFVLLAVWATWHDLARARVATGGGGGVAAVFGAVPALRLSAVGRYVAFFALSVTVAGVGVWATAIVGGHGALLLGQMVVCLRLSVRGLYLARLVRAPLTA